MREVLRYERKFLLPQEEYFRLRGRFEALLHKDAHTGRDGYTIRSLYFDTLHDADYFEKLDVVQLRRKLRLRLYDPAADFAFLELKQKEGEYQLKRSLRLGREAALSLCRGVYAPLLDLHDEFADECYALLTMRGYRPKAVIEYRREAYTARENDTRITFDRDIRASESCLSLFDPRLALYPVMNQGQVVLEVKYNGFLLEYLKELVSGCERSQVSASKYCMGRLASYGLI